MAIKNDIAKTIVQVDSNQAVSELGKLEMSVNELRHDMKGLKRGSDEYVASFKKLKGLEKDLDSHRKKLGVTGMTLGQLVRWQRQLSLAMDNTTTSGTVGNEKLRKKLAEVTAEVNRQKAAKKSLGVTSRSLTKDLMAMGGAYFGIHQAMMAIGKWIRGNSSLSDDMANVAKTTELTAAELDELMARFKSFNTRTTRKELLALAEEAGKMGKRGVNAIAEYVESTNKLTTALDDLGEDAGLKVAKMAERFDVSMDQIGSGINAVADNSKAQAPFITEFLSRLAGTGNEVGIAAGDLLGYGAAIDEMGLKVEMSSTALNGFFIDFVKNTEMYGKAAGFANGELKKLIGEQGTNEGFLAFLERLRAANPEAEDFLKKLEEVGINGDRGSQVFLALAQNVDQLRDRQNLANTEIEKGTSLTNEYNRKNDTLAANFEKLQNRITEGFINSGFVNWIDGIVSRFVDWTEIPLSETMEDQRIKMNALATQAFGLNQESDEYRGIIEELKKQYPDYLGQLDADKTSHEDLVKALKQANEQLIEKIAIQRIDEETMAAATKAAEKRLKAERARMGLAEAVARIATKANAEEQILGKTLEEQVEIISTLISTGSAREDAASGLDYYKDRLAEVLQMEERAAEAAQEATLAQEILNEVRKQFQIEEPEPSGGSGGSGGNGGSGGSGSKDLGYDEKIALIEAGERQITEHLRNQYLQRKIDKETFDAQMKEYEISFLMAKRAAMEQDNQETLAITDEINTKLFNLTNERLLSEEQKSLAYKEWKKDFDADMLSDIDAMVAEELAIMEEKDEKEKKLHQDKIDRLREEAEEREKATKAYIVSTALQIASEVERAESLEGGAVAVINAIRNEIAEVIRLAVARAAADALVKSKIPFPFNIALAGAAAAAASALFKTIVPAAKTKAQRKEERAKKRDGFYHGGDTGTANAGYSDAYGSVSMAGPGFNLHGREIVIPSYERNDPMALNTEAYFASKNPNFKSNINPATVPALGMTPEQAEELINTNKQLLAIMSQRPSLMKSYVVLSEMEAKQLEKRMAEGAGL